ncbi:MAG: glycosyltransferase family 39 protein [Acidobacteriota bacterium]|nr:glycosyltransferase family 39 protein [Acidobacteriota bacterium]
MNRNLPQFLKSQNAAISMLLILTALAVRLTGLSLDSLWFDEVFSVRAAQLSLGQIVSLTIGDVHPPLYYLLLHFWIRFFGETETAVRMLSVCFSVLTVLVVYQLASKLFTRRTAFFAALFTAISPFQVFFAQETRMYSQLAFLSAASFYFLVLWLRDHTRASGVLYVISTTVLLYTHIYAVFVVMAQLLYLVSLFRLARDYFQTRLRRWLTGLSAIGLLFLPWAVVVVRQTAKANHGYWIQTPDWLAPLQTLIEYCGSVWLALLLLPLFVYGVWGSCRAGNDDSNDDKTNSLPHPCALLLLWLILPIVAPFLLSKLLTPFYLAKYTIAASLPFYLFAAFGIAQIRNVVWRAIIVIGICIGAGLILRSDLASLKRERWRDAAYNVEQSAQPGDLVLFNSTGSYLSFEYYAKRMDLTQAVFPYSATDEQPVGEFELLRRAGVEGFGSVHPPQTEQETEEKLQKIVNERRRVWLVTRYDEDFKNDFMKAFGNAFRVTTHPALCVSQRRFLFTEEYSEVAGAFVLEQRGLSCSAQVYLFER